MLWRTLALVSLPLAAIPAARAVQHAVTVGGPGGVVRYDPEFVNASPGDTILFTFMQKNHTATQSSFANPCTELTGGFDTGFQPVSVNNTNGPFPSAELTVSDGNPIWVYCRQTGHCQQGMVFAVNPGDQFAAFQAAANATGASDNSTSSSSTSISVTSTGNVNTNTAAPSVVTVTATVTVDSQTFTTTYGSYPGSVEPTSVTSSDHLITVGGSSTLTFSPSEISAQVGDTITFQFMSKNHTATQSSFNDPCRSLTLTSTTGQVGFDSGFMPVAANVTSFPTFTVQVNNTTPIWVYCRQDNPTSHCGAGMVFAANSIDSGANSFNAFQALAEQLNGTATASGSAASTTSTNAAVSMKSSRGAGVALGFVALVFGALL